MASKPLAFAKWQYPFTLTSEQKAKKVELDRAEESEYQLPEGSNRELCKVFLAALREKKAKWMDESKDYCQSNFAIVCCGDYICLNISISEECIVPVFSPVGKTFPLPLLHRCGD